MLIGCFTGEDYMLALSLLREEYSFVGYAPGLRRVLGNLPAAIMLSQIVIEHNRAEKKAFYRFGRPSPNVYYEPGTSWVELTGLTVEEVLEGLDVISTSMPEDGKRSDFLKVDTPDFDEHGLLTNPQALVLTRKDAKNRRWFMVNDVYLTALLHHLGLFSSAPADALERTKLELETMSHWQKFLEAKVRQLEAEESTLEAVREKAAQQRLGFGQNNPDRPRTRADVIAFMEETMPDAPLEVKEGILDAWSKQKSNAAMEKPDGFVTVGSVAGELAPEAVAAQ